MGSDEHGFAIDGVLLSPATPTLPANTLLDWWSEDEPDSSRFLVKTGSQWGPFAVQVQILEADPGPASSVWEDVVESSVEIADEIHVSEIVDGPLESMSITHGDYRMRIAVRGRTESAIRERSFPDEEGDDPAPLEHYLIAIWPAAPAEAAVVRQDSQYARDEISPPPEPEGPAEREPGLAAAWVIVRDVRGEPGANPVPGELGTVSVEVDVPGLPARVFNRVQYVCGWPTSNGFMGSSDPMATGYHDATLPGGENMHEEPAGHITTTAIELDKPKRVVMRWNWIPTGEGAIASRPALLAEDSMVTIEFEKQSTGDDPRTRVRLTQQGVPTVWVDHLQKLWAWHIVEMASR